MQQYSPNEMVTEKRINSIDLTDHMKNKLIDLSKSKISKRLQDKIDKQIKINKLKKNLNEVLGLGDKKINELIAAGLTSVKQLKLKKWFSTLNIDTQMTLTHNIIRLIEWEDIHKFEHKLTVGDKTVLVGSYRRHKPTIRDIDILFCGNDKDVENYITYLKNAFNNNIWIYAQGNDKISFIIQPNAESNVKYKADIFITTPENYYSTLLYATGSQQHNIKMRTKARKLNLLLNQNGIFKNGKKINKPNDDERRLFALLDMPYVEPEKRF
jgi:DNA polymerase/3'-5' exonuclease PolX